MIDWLTCLADDCPELGGERPPNFLSASERQVLSGLRFPKRRREWVLGRWATKHLLRACHPVYRSLPLHAITVGNDPDGAPYLSLVGKGRLPVCLSISHRDDRAFCVLSRTLPPLVGADLEIVESRDQAFVRDFFTTGECTRVWTCPPSRRESLITVVWSAKEAVLKALRHGLRVDTRSVEILHVAGIEEKRSSTGPLFGRSKLDRTQTVQWVPAVMWYELQIRCMTEVLPAANRPDQVRAWWRPWENYVLTIACYS
jgi:4'-phosphopantetheinyl transferase